MKRLMEALVVSTGLNIQQKRIIDSNTRLEIKLAVNPLQTARIISIFGSSSLRDAFCSLSS